MSMKKYSLRAGKSIQSAFTKLLHEIFPNVDPNIIFNVSLAGGEALQNIARHTYHFADNKEVRCWFEINDQYITLFIEDDGPSLKDLSFLDVERLPSEKGNMGLNLIKKLTEFFTIKPTKDGNLTTLIFSI